MGAANRGLLVGIVLTAACGGGRIFTTLDDAGLDSSAPDATSDATPDTAASDVASPDVAAPDASDAGGPDGPADSAAPDAEDAGAPDALDGSADSTTPDASDAGAADAADAADAQVPPNLCAPNPCLNGGACVNGVGSFTCTCPNGFTGPLCGTNTDDCTPNPCLNGGTCTDGIGSFACACPPRWTGPTCSVDRCVSGIVALGPQGPSCGLAVTCGVAGENCCTSPLVLGNAPGSRCEGTTFFRDYDEAVGNYDTQNQPALVSDFYLDRFEVTVARFKKFVAAFDAWRGAGNPATGGGAHPKIAGSGWDATWPLAADAAALMTALKTTPGGVLTWPLDDVSTTNDQRPISSPTWYEAFAFCHWDGGRLPTETEWTYAALGGAQQRSYPWSVPANDLTATFAHASYSCMGNGAAGCQATDLTNVGGFPLGDGRWGHADLAGNVWKWGLDYFSATFPSNGPGNLCTNCANLTSGGSRSIRGGFHGSAEFNLRGVGRGFQSPTNRNGHSFRCAYDL